MDSTVLEDVPRRPEGNTGCMNAQKASAYLAGQCLVLPLRVGNDGKLGHSPSAAWLRAQESECWSHASVVLVSAQSR